MRFLFGIIIGTVVTLLAATAMDAPDNPVIERAQEGLGRVWDGLIDSTSDSLFEPANSVRPDDLPGEPLKVPDHARSPATALSAPQAVDAPPPAEPRPAPATTPVSATAIAERSQPFVGRPDTPSPGAADDSVEDVRPADLPPEPSTWEAQNTLAEQVWEPFHSQMSARGFAARLSRELDHEFRVERQAPGAYQVVFHAASSEERAMLLAQISEITGQ